jgi:hypothetical protein
MAAGWVVLPTQDQSTMALIIEVVITGLTSHLVGNRPGRYEPRAAVKRRPKPLRLLNVPRDEARELLRVGIDPYKKQK